MKLVWQYVAAVLAAAMLATAAPAAEPVFPPGSRVGVVPLPGMVSSRGIQGFEDPRTRATIFVTEASLRTYPEVEKEFSAGEIKSSGMEEERREEVRLKDGSGFIVVVHQLLGGAPVRKWALVARLDDLTAVVLILLPATAKDAYTDDVLRETLLSVAIRGRVPAEQQLALLPYRIGDLSGFRLVRARPDGVALLTYGPNEAATAEEQPFVLIGTPNVPAPRPGEREMFARQLLATAWDFREARNIRSETIRIAGDPGHEILGDVKSPKTGVELKVVQWLRFGSGNTYIQMLGVARAEVWDEVYPHMRAVRDAIGAK